MNDTLNTLQDIENGATEIIYIVGDFTNVPEGEVVLAEVLDHVVQPADVRALAKASDFGASECGQFEMIDCYTQGTALVVMVREADEN